VRLVFLPGQRTVGPITDDCRSDRAWLGKKPQRLRLRHTRLGLGFAKRTPTVEQRCNIQLAKPILVTEQAQVRRADRV
jgi:hypothetical protein